MNAMSIPSILIVDDEPAVLLTTRLILQSEGYAVAGASTSHEAVQLLKGIAFDLLLLDCIPGNGWLAAEARRIHPHIKIAICSGNPDPSTRPPADDVIEKPMPAPDFLRRVAMLLDHPGAA